MWELDLKEGQALKNWCFQTMVLENTPVSPWTARRSNQSILKEISAVYSLEGLMLKPKLQYSSHLMRKANSLEKTLILRKTESRRKRGQQRMRWFGRHHWLSGHEFDQTLGDGDGQGGLACCCPWGHKESDTNEQLNNNSIILSTQ